MGVFDVVLVRHLIIHSGELRHGELNSNSNQFNEGF